MVEILVNLLKLQRIDTELTRLETKKQDVPRRIEGIQLVVKNKQDELNVAKNTIVELKKKNKLLEVDLKTTEEKINQFSAQLYSAKTNEQYKAFLKEIEGQKKEKAKIEDEIIAVLEYIESTEEKIKILEKELKELEKETQDKISFLKQEEANLVKAVNERINEREQLINAIGKDIIQIYERIRKNKGGVAVVTIESERCQGCFNPIPIQKILEVKKNDRLHFCEYCGRIIVVPESLDKNPRS
ncbi:MAG: C4-type zinc ribbon domain-containing protein [candidate division WOR-3 bacterium]|nr:C4-type zinc ribbon domain-containing protein [candidate division WOR-3 bacterium]